MINLTIEVKNNVVVMMSDMYEPTRVTHSRGVRWGDIMDDVERYASNVNEYLSDMCEYCDYCGDCEVCDEYSAYAGEVSRQVDVVTTGFDYCVLTTRIY